MSEEKKRTQAAKSKTSDESLAEDVLDQASGGGQSGSDLLIVNNGDGSDFLLDENPNQAADQLKNGDSSASDPEWKYTPVRRTT